MSKEPTPYPPEGMCVMSPEQAAVLTESTRSNIITLLAERPATTTQLAAALDKPKGTVGYHLKALEEVELVAVVRTRQVRAITEKYYGRVARTYVFPSIEDGPEDHNFLAEAMSEIRPPQGDEESLVSIRHARIPDDRAAEYADELLRLAERFSSQPRDGDTVYGLLVGLYPTDRPSLKEDEE
jgi:DNA-binding transcriptional ArsR family regulator